MSNTLKDGGPAFPTTHQDDFETLGIGGMSLRDWFAGQALNECVKQAYRYIREDKPMCDVLGREDESPIYTEHASMLALEAYAVADAMLAERAKGGAS